jgi:hypothetical protein
MSNDEKSGRTFAQNILLTLHTGKNRRRPNADLLHCLSLLIILIMYFHPAFVKRRSVNRSSFHDFQGSRHEAEKTTLPFFMLDCQKVSTYTLVKF